ncbi:MAG: serine/threonine protein kinase [Treponema sp.]|nr:serine/threonine protein kinase [Treponema sp.]
MAAVFPEMIGKYKIEGIVAKGGMGVVYKSTHPTLKRPVIIKKLTARKNSANLERFKREAQILNDLQTPYIVHLNDLFKEGTSYYLVEEFVDGLALDKLLQKQTILSPQLASLILQDACLALKYAHSKNIVHRDIKPGNILISKKAEIKLTDFGIASDSAGDDSLTQSGVALGTPAYMPPEQFEDSAKVDCRADIYALGIMLYEMLTGTKPYPGTLSIETLNTIKKGKYISPRKIDKGIPRRLCSLIHKMLRPNAAKRFQSITPILKIIKNYLKQYDTHAIRVELARIVLSKNTLTEPVYVQKNARLKKILRITSIAVLGAAVFSFLWCNGYIHQTVLRKWYTPVKIEMKVPLTAVAGSDVPINAFFYENDGDKIPEIINTRCTLFQLSEKKKPELKKAANKTYVSKKLYLKHGSYRVKVIAGSYVWWKSFAVGQDDVTLSADFLKNVRRQLNVTAKVFDSSTGKDISALSKCFVSYRNAWTELSEVPPEKLLSGNVWKFRFTAEGYTEEIYSLRLDWLQDELYIFANLSPL